MWALGQKPLQSAVALSQLAAFQQQNDFQSSLWLLFSHLTKLKTALLQNVDGVTVEVEHLRCGVPCAYPFKRLSEKIQKSILFCCPPPGALVPFAVDKNLDGSLFWREASDLEVLDASFYSQSVQGDLLLCSSAVESTAMEIPSAQLTVYNCQQCSNPFQMDKSLSHINALTNALFPPSLFSGLTTIASQFQYRSFKWILQKDLLVDKCPFQLQGNPPPHLAVAEESIALLHVSQLSSQRQSTMLSRLPRFVLLEGLQKTFIYHDGKWRSPWSLSLQGKVGIKEIPRRHVTDPSPQPLLWVDAVNEKEYTGSPLLRHRVVLYPVFHCSQLQSS